VSAASLSNGCLRVRCEPLAAGEEYPLLVVHDDSLVVGFKMQQATETSQ
jgi:hypothetical protein